MSSSKANVSTKTLPGHETMSRRLGALANGKLNTIQDDLYGPKAPTRVLTAAAEGLPDIRLEDDNSGTSVTLGASPGLPPSRPRGVGPV